MSILKFILQNLGAILQGVIDVEAAIKAPGATKKQILIGAITAGAKDTEKITDAHIAAVGAVIDASVSALNAAGVFGHTTTPGVVTVIAPPAQ